MSYTILATPPDYKSVHADLVYVVAYPEHTGDPITYANYKFIGDIYVNGALVARLKRIPDPTSGYGIFNIGQIVRSYMALQFNPAPNALLAQQFSQGDFNLSVQVKFGEEYNYTPAYNLVVDSARLFYNSYDGRNIVNPVLQSVTDKVASNRPPYGYVLQSSAYNFVPYFAVATSSVVITVNPHGAGTGWSSTFTPTAANNLLLLNVSPSVLNSLHPGTILSGTDYYTVQIGSQVFTFNIICEPVYSVYTLHFLNQMGGFETRMFSKVSKITSDIARKDFGKLPYTIGADGSVNYKNTNGVINETRSTYYVEYKEKWELNSDILTDWEWTWLNDLVNSPLIYLEQGGLFYPVVLTDNNYETHQAVNDEITNLTVNIEYGVQTNSQIR